MYKLQSLLQHVLHINVQFRRELVNPILLTCTFRLPRNRITNCQRQQFMPRICWQYVTCRARPTPTSSSQPNQDRRSILWFVDSRRHCADAPTSWPIKDTMIPSFHQRIFSPIGSLTTDTISNHGSWAESLLTLENRDRLMRCAMNSRNLACNSALNRFVQTTVDEALNEPPTSLTLQFSQTRPAAKQTNRWGGFSGTYCWLKTVFD